MTKIGIPRQRVPFKGYVFRLLENNDIPNPPSNFNTTDEIWGYFIEEMSKKGYDSILNNLSTTGGSIVSSLIGALSGNVLTINKKDTNVGTGVSIDTVSTVSGGANVVLSGSIPGNMIISVPSVGTAKKFSSTETGTGLVGSHLTLTIADTIPFVTGDILDVGSTVYLANNYTVDVISVTPPNYEAIVVFNEPIIQSDWNQTNTAAEDFIKNKPDFDGLKTDFDDLKDDFDEVVGQFGNGYFVKDIVTTITESLKEVEVVHTQQSIDSTDPILTSTVTVKAGSSLIMVESVDINGDPVITYDVDLTSSTSPIVNEITTIQDDITNIQGDITTIKGNIVTIQGDITTIETNVGNIETNISDIESDITTIKNDLDNKVDKIVGKGLSEEDYTSTEKAKLTTIEAGAQVNVQSDWDQTDNTADDYIKNKPSNISGTWGAIIGDIDDQSDLIEELNLKVDKTSFGDGYFEKEVEINVNDTDDEIVVVHTYESIKSSDPTLTSTLTLKCGIGLSLTATVDDDGNSVVTFNSTSQSSNRMRFVGNGSSNTITLPSTINEIGADVYVNGMLLDLTVDYTLTPTTFKFLGAWTLDSTDIIIIKWYN